MKCYHCHFIVTVIRLSVSVEVVDPWVFIWARLLTRGELPLVPLVANATPVLLLSTPAWSVGEVAVEDWGRMHLWEGFWVSSPGYQLLGGDEVHIRESKDRINKFEESIFTMRPVEKPGSMEKEGEGSFTLCVVLKEILCENLLNGVSIFCVETTISHGARSSSEM